MAADLNNLTPENVRLILDIANIGASMGIDQEVINAAINIANVESSFRYNAQASESTAWGPFQYVDAAWDTGWRRLGRQQDAVGLTIDDSRAIAFDLCAC
jgi:hypothetical protein